MNDEAQKEGANAFCIRPFLCLWFVLHKKVYSAAVPIISPSMVLVMFSLTL